MRSDSIFRSAFRLRNPSHVIQTSDRMNDNVTNMIFSPIHPIGHCVDIARLSPSNLPGRGQCPTTQRTLGPRRPPQSPMFTVPTDRPRSNATVFPGCPSRRRGRVETGKWLCNPATCDRCRANATRPTCETKSASTLTEPELPRPSEPRTNKIVDRLLSCRCVLPRGIDGHRRGWQSSYNLSGDTRS